MNITVNHLTQISPAIRGVRGQLIASAINKVCPSYGINTPDIFHEFIANLLVECAEFTKFEENLNYSPKRLMQVWPKRFPDLKTAQQFAYNGQKLANYVYGSRLGNNRPGDGWQFRGGGPIQITGRENTTKACNYYNKKFNTKLTPEQYADMIRDNANIEMAMHSACWFFAVAKELIDEAINDQFRVIIKRINGGYHGVAERSKYYTSAKQVII